MGAGGTLRITTRSVGTDIQIIFNDSGRGLSNEDIRHIFDPFYKTGENTYGLDLSITYAVIRRHRGTIEVESLSGQGTTFTIHLPREHSS
jgi:signal transduction histidine kinase